MRVFAFFILLNLTACTMASEPKLVEASATVQEPDKKSAFVECMKHKTKEIFPDMPDSVLPSLSLQAQITEREYEKLAKTTNKSPTVLADLELNLEQAKSPRNADAIAMKELTRQCSKHIKW